MNDLRNIAQLKTNTLWLVKPKWYKERYQLTDNAFVYANVYHKGWTQTAFFETADGVLSICNSWSGNLTVKNAEGSILGTTNSKLFSTRTNFTLNNGNTVTFYAPSIWKSEYVWEDEFKNELLRMSFGSLSCTATITFNTRAAEIQDFNTLIFLGLKFHLNKMAMAV